MGSVSGETIVDLRMLASKRKITQISHPDQAQKETGHLHATRERAVPGSQGEPAGSSIRVWGSRCRRGPNTEQTKTTLTTVAVNTSL